MRFTKDNQPARRRKPSPVQKEVLSARVLPETKDYFRHHRERAGDILDEYVKERGK